MKLRGRPKKEMKKRVRSVRLSEKANVLLELICKERPGFNLSKYLSECVIRDFELDNEGYLKFRIGLINKHIDCLYKEQDKLVGVLKSIKQRKIYNR